MRVWAYWEGPKPPHIELCLQTLRKHTDATELGPDTAPDWTDRLDPIWRTLPRIGWRADYLRSRILIEHGGLWIDADTIVLTDPSMEDWFGDGAIAASSAFAARGNSVPERGSLRQ
jgi:hypothetical protein